MSCIIRQKSYSRAENPRGLHPEETGVKMSSRAGRTPRAPVARNLSEKTHQTFTKKFPSRGRKPGRGSIAGTGAPRGQYAHERDAHRTDARKHAGDAVKRRWGEKQRGNCASGARGGLVKSVPGPSSPLGFFPRVGGGADAGRALTLCGRRAVCARYLGDLSACLARRNRTGATALAIVPSSRASSSDRQHPGRRPSTSCRNNAWREIRRVWRG